MVAVPADGVSGYHVCAGLRGNPNLRVIVNQNDFLLADEDLAWLRATFAPEQLTGFAQGGHLGNLSNPTVQRRSWRHSRVCSRSIQNLNLHRRINDWQSDIVGRLADSFGGSLLKAVLISPVALIVATRFGWRSW